MSDETQDGTGSGEDAAGAPVVIGTTDETPAELRDNATGDLFGEPAELTPLIEEPRKRGRPRGSGKKKPASPRERKARKARAQTATKMLDGEIAAASAVAAAAERPAAKPGEVPPAPASRATAEPEAAAVLGDDDMAQIIGLGALGLSMLIPETWGGGKLKDDERELLGRAWFAYLKPYLVGEGGPLALALGATVQVFALRALAASQRTREPDAPVASAETGSAELSGKAKPEPVRAQGLQTPPEARGRAPRAADRE